MAPGLRLVLIAAAAIPLASGCATCPSLSVAPPETERPFSAADRFAFRNELHWSYSFDETGTARTSRTSPPPEYALHCFPMVRAAREFFYHARFDPAQPAVEEEDYRALVKRVVRRDSRRPAPTGERIVIPGYGSLAEFSRSHERLLKEACGGAWTSYTQRGNWRMIFPFTRAGQAGVAGRLDRKLADGRLPIVHLADFPKLRINHAVLLTAVRAESGARVYQVYDPNNAAHFAELRYDPARREFTFERNAYFAGGPVQVYEVYTSALF